MSLLDVLLQLHVLAGSVALASFMVPIIAAKGGPLHRRAGWVFVSAMAVLCLTALPVSMQRMQSAVTTGARLFAQGAVFITILSGSAAWKGIRILRAKGTGRHSHPLDLGVSGVTLLAGLWALLLGIRSWNMIFLFFGPFAALGAAADLRDWLNPNKPTMHWFFAHMSSMLGACIAALTAFLFFGARSFGATTPGVLMFVGPTVALMPVLVAMRRHYRRKLGADTSLAGRPFPAR